MRILTDNIIIERFPGLSDYEEMLAYQRERFAEMVAAKRAGERLQERILFVEHSPVITLGRHAKEENLLFSRESLLARGISCHRIERGGDITYHGPGQLVVYPMIDLERWRLGVKDYVSLLEESVIRTIGEYGILGERVDGASGVWIGKGTPEERKICAVGVKCSRYVTMHGLALNVNTDLSAFTLINPCGFVDKGVTSMALELGHSLDFSQVSHAFERNLLALLQLQSKGEVE